MSKLTDGLHIFLTKPLKPDETFGSLPEDDQEFLARRFHQLATTWLKREPTVDEVSLVGYAFSLGHDWAKDHQKLW